MAAYLAIAGYTAVSLYLSVFGLDYAISSYGRYGFIHIGIIALASNPAPVVTLALAYVGLAYLGFLRTGNTEPYHTIITMPATAPLSLRDFLTTIFGDEHVKRFGLLLPDMFQMVLLALLSLQGATAGEHACLLLP